MYLENLPRVQPRPHLGPGSPAVSAGSVSIGGGRGVFMKYCLDTLTEAFSITAMGGPRVGPEPPERGCPVDRWGSTALVLVLESFKIALNPDGTEGQVIDLVLSCQKCVTLPVILLKREGPASHCLDRFQKPYRSPVVIFTMPTYHKWCPLPRRGVKQVYL